MTLIVLSFINLLPEIFEICCFRILEVIPNNETVPCIACYEFFDCTGTSTIWSLWPIDVQEIFALILGVVSMDYC